MSPPVPNSHPNRRAVIIALSIIVPVLLGIAWSQASFDLKFIHPADVQQTIVLLALSTLIFLAFVIFALILLRMLLKLYVERRQQVLGSRFKTRMLAASFALSLVPVCFLFIFSYGLLNRSIDKWFGTPFDAVRQDTGLIVEQLGSLAEQQAVHSALRLASAPEVERALARNDPVALERLLERYTAGDEIESALSFDPKGRLLARAGAARPTAPEILALFPEVGAGRVPEQGLSKRWPNAASDMYIGVESVLSDSGQLVGTVVTSRQLRPSIKHIAEDIQREAARYDELNRERKIVRLNYLLILGLVALLTLFVATWLALFLSKQVTLPIQALAEGAHEISRGNLGYQVTSPASGELRTLIRSFNEMTRQLQENRAALERAAKDLQRANRELEERGNTMEAILENIPTGVVSFDPQGQITRLNSTVTRMFSLPGSEPPRKLTDLFTTEDAREVAVLFRRAARQGVVTQQMKISLGHRRAAVALTVSSIRVRQGAVGTLLVIEDLTELLRAQRSAAWREVARRLAHEIKNPLTPIQLSAERIRRLVERAGSAEMTPSLKATVKEGVTLIGREVDTLKTLVNEFSEFARFPASRPAPSSLNEVISNALQVFDGRLGGITVHQDLAPVLPQVLVDAAQMKRVLINLIDNAAEALENAPVREIWVRTALDAEHDIVEVVVADSGPGIAPDVKERLFLPYFSTKHRGTGLGLAIASHIVAEHKGSIRVEDNRPTGSQFIIELPLVTEAQQVFVEE